jgi:hypothetical protein
MVYVSRLPDLVRVLVDLEWLGDHPLCCNAMVARFYARRDKGSVDLQQ